MVFDSKRKRKAAAKKFGAASTEPQHGGGAAGKGAWLALDTGSMIVAGFIAPRLIRLLWQTSTGRTPPTSTRSPEISVWEAIAWAAVAGALTQVIRTGIARAASDYWVRSTGQVPPSLRTVDPLKK